MASFVRRHRRLILLLLMLVPTILFGWSYAAGATAGTRTEHVVQGPTDWTVSLSVSHPGYVESGQQVPVVVTVGVQTSSSNFTVGVNDVGVEIRQPTAINTTSGIVSSWAVLSSAKVNINQNFTGGGTVQKTLTLNVASPPSNGAADLLVPVASIAFNAVSDITVYQQVGNVTNSTPQSLSLIDSVTFYDRQLSIVASTSSWVTYQLVAALVVAAALITTRPSPMGPAAVTYTSELKKFKTQRTLARLEELRNSGKMSQSRYDELRQQHQKDQGS